MKHKLLNQIIHGSTQKKERKEPFKKRNTIISFIYLTPQTKRCLKCNNTINDDESMNLIFTPIDKTKYRQLPKHEIDEEEENRMISFIKTSIVQDITTGKYEINTQKLPKNNLRCLTNDTQNKYEDNSTSSRGLLTSATTNQLSTGIISQKVSKIQLKAKEYNKSPQSSSIKHSPRIKKIPLTSSRNSKMSTSPKNKSDRRSIMNYQGCNKKKIQIDQLIQSYFNKKGYKI